MPDPQPLDGREAWVTRIVDDPPPAHPEPRPRRRWFWPSHQEQQSPKDRFRRRLCHLEAGLQAICHRVQEITLQLFQVDGQIQDLRRQHPRFASHAGRHLATAILIAALPLISWGLDFVLLSPLIDFLLGWAGLRSEGTGAETTPILIRMLGALLWMFFGYAIGSYVGISFEQRRSPGPGWWPLVLLYVPAMPLLAWATSSLTDLRPLHGAGLTLMAIVGSTLPILLGALSNDAKDYLIFIFNLHRLRRRERSLKAQRCQLGFQAVRQFNSFLREAEEYERRFGEPFQVRLDDVSRRVIEEFSSGRIRIEFQEPSRPEARPDAPPVDGGGAAVPTSGASPSEDTQREYARRLRQQLADLEDCSLRPAQGDDFSVHLP